MIIRLIHEVITAVILWWLEMTLFSKKASHKIDKLHGSAKTYDILLKSKGFESLWSGFVICEKKLFFVLGMANEDPIFA